MMLEDGCLYVESSALQSQLSCFRECSFHPMTILKAVLW